MFYSLLAEGFPPSSKLYYYTIIFTGIFLLSTGGESDDPDFQPSVKEVKSSKTMSRKASSRKSTRKTKAQWWNSWEDNM